MRIKSSLKFIYLKDSLAFSNIAPTLFFVFSSVLPIDFVPSINTRTFIIFSSDSDSRPGSLFNNFKKSSKLLKLSPTILFCLTLLISLLDLRWISLRLSLFLVVSSYLSIRRLSLASHKVLYLLSDLSISSYSMLNFDKSWKFKNISNVPGVPCLPVRPRI